MAGDGWTSRLLTGLAELLATQGIGDWRPDGSAYEPAETAIVIRDIPTAPDRLITLAAYPVGGGTGNASITQGVQIRVRGLPEDVDDCDDLADSIFDVLDSAGPLYLGGVGVSQAYRQSYTSLGKDARSRWERSENYYLDAERPTVHRPY